MPGQDELSSTEVGAYVVLMTMELARMAESAGWRLLAADLRAAADMESGGRVADRANEATRPSA